MEKVTVLSDEEVEKMYPKDSSHIARIVHDTVDSGLKVAIISSNSFFGSFERIVGVCMSAIEKNNRFNRMMYIIDFSKEKKQAVVALDYMHTS